jgi:hypothetical protein
MGTQALPESAVVPLVEKVQVGVSEGGQEAVGVLLLPGVPVGKSVAEPVFQGQRRARDKRGEDARAFESRERDRVAIGHDDLHTLRVGVLSTNHHAGFTVLLAGMGTQESVRLVMLTGGEAIDLGLLSTGSG